MLRWALPPLLLLLTAAAEPPLRLREQSWTAPQGAEGDLAFALTHAPAACESGGRAHSEAGRALFRSPMLLGGPAARAGLSCHACHSNGRANARFMLPELTNRPGAADVTSEWAGHVRGDGVMNPLDIPDLAGVSARQAFGHARDPSLRHFVRGVIVEEFQGAAATEDALDSVIAYLNTLEPNCVAGATPITLSTAADDTRRAFAAAEAMPNWPTSSLVLAATQDAIGRIAERLPAPKFRRERQALATLSREITAMRNGGAAALRIAAPGWSARFDATIAQIERRERRTYFNEATLRAALRP